MSPTDVIAPPKSPRTRWRRRITLALLVLVVAAGGGIGLMFYLAEHQWHEAVAEADRLDPGWRFEELESRRDVIPDVENAARRVLAAAAALPASWPPVTPGVRPLNALAPTEPLTADLVGLLTAVRAGAPAGLDEARKLKDLPRGRFPIALDPTSVPDLGAHTTEVLRVSQLLIPDALLRADDHDLDGATDATLALVNLARSCGDAPDYGAQHVRMKLRAPSWQIERILAQGPPSAARLVALQRLLEAEEREPLFLFGARGLRAWMHATLEAVHEGRMHPGGLPGWASPGLAANLRPTALRTTTRVVEIAKRPVEEQDEALRQQWLPEADDGSFLARVYIGPKIHKVAADLLRDQLRSQAELRVLIVALAAERYRRDHDGWPASAAALVPDYLGAVPTDPFDGRPLRYLRVVDGVIVYSTGPDGTDEGGKLDRVTPGVAGTDVGVQLWNADRRRWPAE